MGIILLFAFGLVLLFFGEWLLRQLKIDKYESRYVLITGCDTGFGNALAKKLNQLGFYVFACCLTKSAVEKFDAESSDKLKAIEMDVTKDASIEKAVEIVERMLPEGKGLWAVVNNAGIFGGIGSIKLHTRQDYENTLAVNLYGVIMVTKACMSLVLKEKGRFVNTSSTGGRLAFFNSSYCISKYGVEAFSDVLRRELYRTGVKVQIIEPGGFKTQILGGSDIMYIRRLVEQKMASLPAKMKSELPADATDQLTAFMNRSRVNASTDISQVVDAYVHAITAKFPKKRYMVGFASKYLLRFLWTVPECISDYCVEMMQFNSI